MRLQINERGQCPPCGRKPLVYRRRGFLFCCRCDRAYDLATGAQIPNWAWEPDGSGGMQRTRLGAAGGVEG